MDVSNNVSGVELLQQDDKEDEEDNGSDDAEETEFGSSDNDSHDGTEIGSIDRDAYSGSNDSENESGSSSRSEDDLDSNYGSMHDMQEENELSEDEDATNFSDDETNVSSEDNSDYEGNLEDSNHSEKACGKSVTDSDGVKRSKSKKRKFSDFDKELNAASKSLRALKKLAGDKEPASVDLDDCILSNEDFKRIRELKVCLFCTALICDSYQNLLACNIDIWVS